MVCYNCNNKMHMNLKKNVTIIFLIAVISFVAYGSVVSAAKTKNPPQRRLHKATDQVAIFNGKGSVVVHNALVTNVSGDTIIATTNIEGVVTTWTVTKKQARTFGAKKSAKASVAMVSGTSTINVGDKVDIVGSTRQDALSHTVKVNASQVNKRTPPSPKRPNTLRPKKEVVKKEATTTPETVTPPVVKTVIETELVTTVEATSSATTTETVIVEPQNNEDNASTSADIVPEIVPEIQSEISTTTESASTTP